MLVPRGKVTGGSSAINGEIFLRGVAEDFDRWRPPSTNGGVSPKCSHSIVAWSTISILVATITARTTDSCPPLAARRVAITTVGFLRCLPGAGFPDVADHNAPGASGWDRSR